MTTTYDNPFPQRTLAAPHAPGLHTTNEGLLETLVGQTLSVSPTVDPSYPAAPVAIAEALKAVNQEDPPELILTSLLLSTAQHASRALRQASTGRSIQEVESYSALALRFINANTRQAEALAKLRSKGQQTITIRHLNLAEGAQAVVGVVAAGRRNGGPEDER